MKRTGWAALALGMLLLAGCGPQAGTTSAAGSAGAEATAEETAREVLTALYTAGAQDSSDFEEALARSATGESALDEYLVDKTGDKLSAEGMEKVLANRVVSRVLDAWPATEVEVGEISLTAAGSSTDTDRYYTYSVEAAPDGEDGQTFTGDITLTMMDGVWQVSGIS